VYNTFTSSTDTISSNHHSISYDHILNSDNGQTTTSGQSGLYTEVMTIEYTVLTSPISSSIKTRPFLTSPKSMSSHWNSIRWSHRCGGRFSKSIFDSLDSKRNVQHFVSGSHHPMFILYVSDTSFGGKGEVVVKLFFETSSNVTV
jgi:hypothetical protein